MYVTDDINERKLYKHPFSTWVLFAFFRVLVICELRNAKMRIGKTLNFSVIFFYIFNLWRLIVLAWITTLSAERLQLLGDFVPRPPTMFHISAKLNNLQTSNF